MLVSRRGLLRGGGRGGGHIPTRSPGSAPGYFFHLKSSRSCVKYCWDESDLSQRESLYLIHTISEDIIVKWPSRTLHKLILSLES